MREHMATWEYFDSKKSAGGGLFGWLPRDRSVVTSGKVAKPGLNCGGVQGQKAAEQPTVATRGILTGRGTYVDA